MVHRGESARIIAAHTQISHFKTALAAFEVDNGHFPSGRNGLQALLAPPSDAIDWKGPYLEEIPLDPWKHPYLFECPGKHSPFPFDITSMGPDGQLGTSDDISNWAKAVEPQ